MITIHIADIRRADAEYSEGFAWVTLRLGDDNRVTVHARNRDQAVAIANAVNGESETRGEAAERLLADMDKRKATA